MRAGFTALRALVEKRRDKRARRRVRAALDGRPGRLIDLSLGGAAFHAGQALRWRAGRVVTLAIPRGPAPPVQLRAVVLGAIRRGKGLRLAFIGLGDEDFAALEDILLRGVRS